MSDNNDSLEDIIAQVMEKKKNGQLENNQLPPVSEEEKALYEAKNAPVPPERKDIQQADKKKKKKMSKKKKALIIIAIIVLIIAILLGVGVAIIYHYINKINIVEPRDENNNTYEVLDSIEPDDDITDEPDSPQEDIDKLEEDIKRNLEENAVDIMHDEDVLNVLLIGTDARDKNSRGRSDSMILVSINKKSKKIIMTSFLRDIYLAIPGKETTRLNHSYAYGGADLLIETLEQNFKIKIDKYVQVNFYSFVEVINSVDGVEIEVTDDEVYYINQYLDNINNLEGRAAGTDYLSKGGKYKLNGEQALAYSRIRYIGTDFGRTERQRKVLEQIINNIGNLSLSEMTEMLDLILPAVTTDIQKDEVFSLILDSSKYLKYEREQCRVPADGTWWNLTIRGMMVLGIDFDANINYLQEHIYG